MQRLLPHFNPELNWGHILSAGTFFVFGLVAFFSLQRDLGELRTETRLRVTAIEQAILLISQNLTKVSDQILVDVQQTARLESQDRRLDIQSRRIDRLESLIFKVTPLGGDQPALPKLDGRR